MKSIETQHEHLHLIMFYKSLHGLSDLEMPTCITPAIRYTRGNCIKFVQPPAQVDPYKFSFFPRSIYLWNRLQINNTITTLGDFRNLNIVLYSILTFTVTNK